LGRKCRQADLEIRTSRRQLAIRQSSPIDHGSVPLHAWHPRVLPGCNSASSDRCREARSHAPFDAPPRRAICARYCRTDWVAVPTWAKPKAPVESALRHIHLLTSIRQRQCWLVRLWHCGRIESCWTLPVDNFGQKRYDGGHSATRNTRASSPTTPRRKASTHTTKIVPWITKTHWPNGAR
jgi:hypothetical protein